MNRTKSLIIPALVSLVATPMVGQRTSEPDLHPRHVLEHGFEDYLFPPDLVKEHQSEIALTTEQRAVITQAIKGFQEQVIETQWQMDEEQLALVKMLEAATTDEAQVLAQMDRLLGLEARVKRAHLGMLLRIKNTLTAEQQKQLGFLHQRHVKEEEAARHREPHPLRLDLHSIERDIPAKARADSVTGAR